ncbi:hypothetical protein QLQ15_01990 [Lysobacter sp. LF1]|uniref:Uncharacterized protein n=1 Tax=Lysobacter stagni TaxID=3045172 RepID=A0ABT6XCM2_9GAMM|nr:hypothetical protein [Lysobacter sp. LF1]MDI9237678.1 hypothetical protein [Lysobacter sp. LF1]
MESSEEFKQAFAFLERSFAMKLIGFAYDETHFGNIVAEYGGRGITVKIVRDRGIAEIHLSKDGATWMHLPLEAAGSPADALLQWLCSHQGDAHS